MIFDVALLAVVQLLALSVVSQALLVLAMMLLDEVPPWMPRALSRFTAASCWLLLPSAVLVLVAAAQLWHGS